MTTELKNPACPKCGAIMTMRTNKSNGRKFWGCSKYFATHCNGLLNFTPADYDALNASNKPTQTAQLAKADFILTAEQLKVIAEFENTDSNLFVNAGPGCGKTFELVRLYLTDKFKTYKNPLIVTFGKKQSLDMIERGLTIASTLHSTALKCALQIYPKTRITSDNGKPNKIKNLIMTCGLIAEDDRKSFIAPLTALITLLDANLLSYTLENIKMIVESSAGKNIDIDVNAELEKVLNDINTRRIATRPVSMDFEDTLRIVIENAKRFNGLYDVTLADETQDFSLLNLKVIEILSNRLIAVGDENQSIYTFRGASQSAITNLCEVFQPVKLYLTETRRIPQLIVKDVINRRFENIPLTSSKNGGEFIDGLDESLLTMTLQAENEGAYIICRNNAPLVKPAYQLIKAGESVCILGDNIADELILLVNHNRPKEDSDSIDSMLAKVSEYIDATAEKYTKAKRKNFLEKMEDQFQTLSELSNYCDNVDDMILKITNLFSTNPQNVKYTFMTGHKAKGLEHKNVYIIGLDLIGKKAETDEERRQEENLLFVMLTRTLDKLVTVGQRLF